MPGVADRARGRLRGWAREPLFWILVAGLALRLVVLLSYRPAFIGYADSGAYIAAADGPIFNNGIRQVGYPAFLRALHVLPGGLATVAVVQHALGLGLVAVVYVAMRRLGAPRWAACVPAAFVALSAEQVMYEHAVLSELLFEVLLIGAVAIVVVAAERTPGRRARALLAGAGALLGVAAAVRLVGAFAVPVLVVAVALAGAPRPWRRRCADAAALALPALALVLAYAALQEHRLGTFGVGTMGGWSLYARTAPIADCRVLDLPPSARGLCETVPVRDRPAPDAYLWTPRSPAWALGLRPPGGDAPLRAFGRAVIRQDPGAYARAVAKDLARYVHPSWFHRLPQDPGAEGLDLDFRDAAYDRDNAGFAARYYGPTRITRGGATGTLGAIQPRTRLAGAGLVLAALLTLAGVALGRGRVRGAVLAGAAIAAVLLAAPVVLVVFNERYMAPVAPLLVMTAALGAWATAERIRRTPADRR